MKKKPRTKTITYLKKKIIVGSALKTRLLLHVAKKKKKLRERKKKSSLHYLILMLHRPHRKEIYTKPSLPAVNNHILAYLHVIHLKVAHFFCFVAVCAQVAVYLVGTYEGSAI